MDTRLLFEGYNYLSINEASNLSSVHKHNILENRWNVVYFTQQISSSKTLFRNNDHAFKKTKAADTPHTHILTSKDKSPEEADF